MHVPRSRTNGPNRPNDATPTRPGDDDAGRDLNAEGYLVALVKATKGLRSRALQDPRSSRKREKTMSFHINRVTYRTDLAEEQRQAGLEMLRQSGEQTPR